MLERVLRQPTFRVCCFGAFKIVETQHGTDLTPTGRKARALIAYLCLMNQPVTRVRLTEMFWGDRGEEQARASLRQTLHEMRSLPGGDRLLQAGRDTVTIGGEVSTDLAAAEAAARDGDLEELADVLSAWRGDLFEELTVIDPSFDSWLEAERLRLGEKLVTAASDAVRAGMARGELAHAREVINLLQHRDGANEAVLRLGLTLDSLCGDSAGLRRRYDRFRQLLRSELDAAPSGETQQLFHELAARTGSAMAPSSDSPATGLPSNALREDTTDLAATTGAASRAEESVAPPARSRPLAMMAAAATIVVALAALGWAVWRPLRAPPPPAQPLLAVLPFQNLTGDSRTRYFSDGMTEEIVDALLRTTDIRAASPASSFRFRTAGARKAAKALSATHVLSGSVQRSGNRVHVVAQLTDFRGKAIWSQTYDRTIAEAPLLQQDIAFQIADALDMRLSPGSLAAAHQVNPLAYDRYLKARDLFMQRDPAALPEAAEAVRLAPRFAKAWSTLAAARFVYAGSTLYEQRNDYDPSMERDARAAAKHALALDPGDGEALAVEAMTASTDRLKEIDGLFARALRAEPNNTQLLNWHASFLNAVGRLDESLGEWSRAYELDRLTQPIALNFAFALLEEGYFDDYRKIAAVNRGSSWPYYFDLGAEERLFRRDWRGLADYLSALPDDLSPERRAYFRLARETAAALAVGDKGKFAALRARWRQQGIRDGIGDPVQFLAALGDTDGALQTIELAISRRRSATLMESPEWSALFMPNLASLRRDPRFPALLAKWGLFDYWRAAGRWPDFCSEPGLPFDCKAEAAKFSGRKA